jgi:hypothetical protein
MKKDFKSQSCKVNPGVQDEYQHLPGEREGAYARRIATIKKSVDVFKKHQKMEDELKEKNAPTSFGGKLVDKFITQPMKFVEGKINRFIDYIKTPVIENGNMEYCYLSDEDRKSGNNQYAKITNGKGLIILFARVVVVKKLIAVTNFLGSKADKGKQALNIINKAATATLVTVLPADIAALLLLVPLYSNSLPGEEETTWNNLYNGIYAMKNLFQVYANGHPTMAETAILQGGFTVKRITSRDPQKWTAVPNAMQGTVDLTAAGSVSRSLHDWWFSTDGKIFVRLDPTMLAHTQVTGLAGNTIVYFMHQVITVDGPQGFDLTIKYTVPA